MTVFFLDGNSIEIKLDPDILWEMYQASLKGVVKVTLLIPLAKGSISRDIEEVDMDRTFSEVILPVFPSLPPDVPLPPDTLEDEWSDDDGDCHHSTPPRSDPLPSRDK